MRSEGYSSRSVCASVSHLALLASLLPENAVTYSAGDEGQKLWDSYEGVRSPPGWSTEGLFGSARRGHLARPRARLAKALSWFDVDTMAGWVAPLVRIADIPHDVISNTCPYAPKS